MFRLQPYGDRLNLRLEPDPAPAELHDLLKRGQGGKGLRGFRHSARDRRLPLPEPLIPALQQMPKLTVFVHPNHEERFPARH